ncbi:hypothetical protein MSG28_008531 [Choristoneura fumiferana]|uniref:Uncharacterized protein n=1 Tax=Choristoneura fumiferana TaxID=7141 RepID=A0ACC0J733_CHOFU|nr:hypothetical protein MSG28_008531 [Choristoneura fumiferana]
MRKAVAISHQLAIRTALLLQPAVVDGDVVVASFESTLQRYRCQVSQPIGGVSASPLSSVIVGDTTTNTRRSDP